MRRPALLALAVLAFAAVPALAQNKSAESAESANRQPLPAVPPPPPEMLPFDAALEPQVTIKKLENETVEEFRSNGKLYMVKVTPLHGVPYYLIDSEGNGNFARMETLDAGIRVPQWIIKTF